MANARAPTVALIWFSLLCGKDAPIFTTFTVDSIQTKLYIQNPLNATWRCTFSPSECVGLLDCSLTQDDFYDELEKTLTPLKMHRPVKKFSDALNVSIDMTVVGLLGVVSLWDANKPSVVAPCVSGVMLKCVSTLGWEATVPDRVYMAGPGTFSEFVPCETLSALTLPRWRYLGCL